MINLADKLTAKTVEGILADSNEIKYTKEMGDTSKAETVAKELSNLTDSMSGLSNSVTTLSQEFEITQSDIEKLLNKSEQYTDRFVDNPIANSENAGLMSAADKTKLDSYPSQFVLDLGDMPTQAEGEARAARSEVAGNRNISFIRFQVQGVSTLKTTLIMQWPNGINETTQIMCVDKAQWRRNVTGATGVKGATTSAYKWERIAPQRIVYNASNRKIRLEDYEHVLVSDVELPIATHTQPGLMSSADKTKLDNYPETPLEISIATSSLDGLMSAADKAALDTAKADITSMQSSKAEKTDLDAAKDEISENARLIEALESSLESTDEKADTAMRILTFASTVENVNIEEQIISSDFSILYDIGRGCFVALKDGKYYSSFLGSENYNSIFGGVLKPREDRLFLSLDDNFIYHYDGTKLRYFAITDDERTKLLAYPSNPLGIKTATTMKPGLMSAEDKTKLDQTKPVEEVTWTKDHHMSGYTECGEFHIKGQRLNKYDGMPILNANPGHTIDAMLTVLDSSLSGGTGAKTDTCVTQILRISNRTGGDGHVYVRTGQGVDKEQLAWGTWEKLMGMFEKNTVDTIEGLDGYTTNGMYSGIYAADTATHGGVQFSPGDTFLIVTVNGYAVGLLGNNQLNPQITQLLYKLPAKTLGSEQNAEIYLRTGSYNKVDKVWVWGNFTKMVTNTDLASQVETLTAKINHNSANIASATTTASEALTTAQEAQAAATSASENAAQAQGTATNALSEAIEAKSNAATAFGAASNAKSIADTAQTKNIEQDERLIHIEENLAHLGIAGRCWNEDNATSTAENYYGSLQALRDLPKRLGLGRYLVTDNRKRKKLDPKDSTKYLDGSPAALDGSEGQCMWCWNGFYANVWHEGSRLIKAVTFDKPIGGETSVWIPAGGISWLCTGVMDRTNNILCSVINDSEQFRGGYGAALDPSKYSKSTAADSPQITMLGMPATTMSIAQFGDAARKRGEGWEANWFVARFVVEFLFEVIMGTENSQAAFNAEKDANGLYQGGFGTGVTGMSDWNGYNDFYPVIPTSVGLEAGDGVCLVPYSLPKTDGAEGEAYKTFNVPVFFGLVGAGFGNLCQLTRGLIMDAGDKSLVYVTPSMYADYDPNTVADKILVAECPQKDGYIKRKSYQGLCCMPTEVGGTQTTRFGDYFGTNAATSKGLRVRAAGGHADLGAGAGASCTYVFGAASGAYSDYSAPLCYFEEDPVIPETQKIG